MPKLSDDQVARRVMAMVADAADCGAGVQLQADQLVYMTLQQQRRVCDQLAAAGLCERLTPRSWAFSVRGVQVPVTMPDRTPKAARTAAASSV